MSNNLREKATITQTPREFELNENIKIPGDGCLVKIGKTILYGVGLFTFSPYVEAWNAKSFLFVNTPDFKWEPSFKNFFRDTGVLLLRFIPAEIKLVIMAPYAAVQYTLIRSLALFVTEKGPRSWDGNIDMKIRELTKFSLSVNHTFDWVKSLNKLPESISIPVMALWQSGFGHITEYSAALTRIVTENSFHPTLVTMVPYSFQGTVNLINKWAPTLSEKIGVHNAETTIPLNLAALLVVGMGTLVIERFRTRKPRAEKKRLAFEKAKLANAKTKTAAIPATPVQEVDAFQTPEVSDVSIAQPSTISEGKVAELKPVTMQNQPTNMDRAFQTIDIQTGALVETSRNMADALLESQRISSETMIKMEVLRLRGAAIETQQDIVEEFMGDGKLSEEESDALKNVQQSQQAILVTPTQSNVTAVPLD